MDTETYQRVIADLENMFSFSEDDEHELVDLGAQALAEISPSLRPPDNLSSKILDRISAEPARVKTDPMGRITAVNPAFSRLCGYRFNELRGEKPSKFLQGPETEQESVEQLRSAVLARIPCSTELTNYHKDGSKYRVRIEMKPIFDSAGEIQGFEACEWEIG